MSAFTESVVEDAALARLESLGWSVKHGPDVAPGELAAERSDYAQVVLAERLRQALARLNPTLPPEALADASRKLTRPEGPTLEARNLVPAVRRLPTDLQRAHHRGLRVPAPKQARGLESTRFQRGNIPATVRGLAMPQHRMVPEEIHHFI